MAKIIPFPKPRIKLTEEESKAYQILKKELEEINGLWDLFQYRRRVKKFLKKVEERNRRGD